MGDYTDPWPMATVVHTKTFEDAHREGQPNVFIQWKGTDVCFDFWCTCGGGGHYDGYFAYCFTCPKCSAIYEMPSTIIPAKLDKPGRWHNPVTLDVDDG